MIALKLLLGLIVLSHLVLVGILIRKRPTPPAGKPFTLFVFIVTAWAACVAILTSAPHLDVALWAIRTAHACAILGIICWVWFCAMFPTPARRFRGVAWGVTGSGLPLLCISWSPQIIVTVTRESWGINAVVGPWLPVFTLWVIVCALIGMVRLAYQYRTSKGLERMQISYVLLGCAGLVAGSTLCNLILPLCIHSFRYAPFSILASVCLTVAISYAIFRYRLMDITLVIRTGVIYAATITALSLVFALLNGLLTARFSNGLSSFIMAVCLTLGFQPIRWGIQRLVDRHLFKQAYDFRVVLQAAGRQLAATQSEEEVGQTIVTALCHTMSPERVAIFLREEDGTFSYRQGVGETEDLPVTLAEDGPFLAYGWRDDDVLLAHELRHGSAVQRAVSARMYHLHIALVFPILAEGQLAGFALLGEKRSGKMYTADDIGLLRLLGQQAASALQQIRQYRQMISLQETERLRTRFLSYISHELKTPMTPIITGVEVLEAELVGPLSEKQRQVVEMIANQSKRLHRLIKDLLDLMLLEQNRMALTITPQAVAPLIRENTAAYTDLYQQKSLELQSDIPEDLPSIMVDHDRFGQILGNLLDNAYKCTQQGAVTVTATGGEGVVTFTVTDTGIGMHEIEVAQLFHVFDGTGHARQVPGTGLGLAIVKSLVEAHGGTITAASAGPGQGSTITFSLPVAPTLAAVTV